MEDTKAELRERARQRRRGLSDEERAQQSQGIFEQLSSLPAFGTAATVASYESWPTEPDTSAVNQALLDRGAEVMVPGGGLAPYWRSLRNPDKLLPARTIRQADLVIVPALAIDSHGNRLGRGAGWYDKMLSEANPDAIVASLLFDGEYLPDQMLPSETHDVPVHYIVTPSQVFTVPS